jgi:flagellar biosynthesis/type III secretory pathway M-ring protein FliF/YscJ
LAGKLLELQREQEEHYAKKIYDHLKHIDGVVVNVRARLRQDDEQVNDLKLGPPVVSKVEEESEEMQGASSAAGPGVRPNQARQITDAGSGSSNNKTKNVETSEGRRDETKKAVVKKAGAVERVTASVSVPSAFLLAILKAQQPNGTDTSLGAIQKVADIELPRIQHQIEPLIAEAVSPADKGEKLVVVDWYYAMEEAAVGGGVTQAASFDVLALAKGYGPQVGLGLLAVFSLFAVLRIAKKAQATMAKSGPVPAVAGSGAEAWETAVPLQTLGGGPQPVGEAQELEGVLMGHEVDESMVRTHQIVKQIGQAVREDPAAVTGLIDYWMKDQK